MNLHRAVEQYILLKQSLGFRFRIQSYVLRAFSRAMRKVTVGQVAPASARAYLNGHGPVTEAWVQKWSILRDFYAYAIARGMARRSPLPLKPPKVPQTFTPYIYSQKDLHRLLEAITPERTRSLSPQTMRTLLFLYNTGARVSEACRLTVGDLDLAGSVATLHGKGRKIRRCPLWKVTASVLCEVVAGRPSSQAVFVNHRGQPLTRYGIHTLIERHAHRAAAKAPALSAKRVSPHCLRHYADLRTMPTGTVPGRVSAAFC